MSILKALIGEIIGMFVDDGSLALAIVAIAAVSYLLSTIVPEHLLVAGGFLYIGCLVALVENCFRSVWSRRR